ncbi:MAG: DUF721 domain-containing protein [Betaproteobacteria bacterium]|nr:DUF721 domain-containing protein [Betaproteobacteria bacterium]
MQDIIGGDPVFGSLKARLKHVAPLQEALQRALPAALRPHAQVTTVEGPRLQVQVSSQAVAAKLRMLAPTLLRDFQRLAPEISTVQFQVAPTAGSPSRHRMANELPDKALDHFESLAGALPPSPLRTAVLRLLQARGRGN